MIIENQEFINTKEAAVILGYAADYIRQLCVQEEYKEKFNAQKFSGRWILHKEKVKKYAEEREREKKVKN